MEKLIQMLNSIAPLSTALQTHLNSVLKRNTFKKRSYILQAGQVSNCIHFLESGIVRCFYDRDEQEICIWFMDAGNVVISVESFLRQIKSYQYIQAIDNSITWSITYTELHDIYKKYPEFNFHRAVLLEKYYVESEKRQRILSLNTASERYALLMETQPDITLQLPAKYIASYLNIDESYLSKIKAKFAS
ncbi:Crp/Fnr family transcriptional regulator [Ilyomonas limi]|uniref:Crp/Fnr family transcriptional regulator n=1 Tax=Ilyomonas limi TaxID=2575867 RepID=A0A4U3KYV3_9BACT|nr:Crp/Fnr family transcriptional regulator [Ilyomonas limi]TKK66346.1 Crp/Fnr family transcriptional regulator [Ilyomonas limi]